MTDEEFENKYGSNWMVQDSNYNYYKVDPIKIIITNCKDTNGNISNVPYIACDNTEMQCFMECFSTIEAAIDYLMED